MQGDLSDTNLDEKTKGLLEFAELITRNAYKTTAVDVELLREAGWEEPQIAEAVYVIALFAFFNRVADAFGIVEPNLPTSHDPLS